LLFLDRRDDARVTLEREYLGMPATNLSRTELNRITGEIVDSAIKVHKHLGPGLLESAYQACLAYELRKRGFHVAEHVPIDITYEELRVPIAYRADMVVNDAVVTELKAVSHTTENHEAQLQTQLGFGGFRVGLMINFHATRLRDGIHRRVNSF
jgi:GxxExxY protein